MIGCATVDSCAGVGSASVGAALALCVGSLSNAEAAAPTADDGVAVLSSGVGSNDLGLFPKNVCEATCGLFCVIAHPGGSIGCGCGPQREGDCCGYVGMFIDAQALHAGAGAATGAAAGAGALHAICVAGALEHVPHVD